MIAIGFDPGLAVSGAALVRRVTGPRPYRIEAVDEIKTTGDCEASRLVELVDWSRSLASEWSRDWPANNGHGAAFAVEGFEVQGSNSRAVARFLNACRAGLRAQAAIEVGVMRGAGGACAKVNPGQWHRALKVPKSSTGKRSEIKSNARRWLTVICENVSVTKSDHQVDAAFVAIHELNRSRICVQI